MRRPITVEIEVHDEFMNYSASDAFVLASAVRDALLKYIDQGGFLESWNIMAEPVELNEWVGIRLVLEGEEAP